MGGGLGGGERVGRGAFVVFAVVAGALSFVAVVGGRGAHSITYWPATAPVSWSALFFAVVAFFLFFSVVAGARSCLLSWRGRGLTRSLARRGRAFTAKKPLQQKSHGFPSYSPEIKFS